MPKTNTKREGNILDTHLRVFKKVLLNPKLTILQKLILSDVISFTINGDKRYFKTSAQLAKQLGSYSTKAIQANFQRLNDMGYLNTQPIKLYDSENSLREASVVQIEQWIYPDEYLAANSINILPLVVKTSGHPLKTMWSNSGKRPSGKPQPDIAEPSTSTRQNLPTVEPVTDTVIGDDEDESELTIGFETPKNGREISQILQSEGGDAVIGVPDISFDLICFSDGVRKSVVEKIDGGYVPNYQDANIVFDYNDKTPCQLIKIYDDIDQKTRYLTKHFIETGVPQ